jgi:mannosyl-3-phosphoglycerate phosphatase
MRRQTAELSYLIATDLDGTLLDETTYSFEMARTALDAIAVRGIPLVLASSKTEAEMAEVARGLGAPCSLIVENGGALLIHERHATPSSHAGSRRGAFTVMELGVPRAGLIEQLAAIAREVEVRVRGFASMDVGEIAQRTGLPIGAARLAAARHYDEPFTVEAPDRVEPLKEAARRRGLVVTRGGRFFHLTGAHDKGRALRLLLETLEAAGHRYLTVGLGDSANDVSLLAAVSRPVIVPRPGGEPSPELVTGVSGAERAPVPGPQGWNEAVLAVLAGRRLPVVSGTTA